MEKLKKPNLLEGYNPTFLDKINEIVDWINKCDRSKKMAKCEICRKKAYITFTNLNTGKVKSIYCKEHFHKIINLKIYYGTPIKNIIKGKHSKVISKKLFDEVKTNAKRPNKV